MAKKKVDPNAELKAKFLDYYKSLPIQKLAAGYIGKHENTIIAWKNDDQTFCDQVEEAASLWAKVNASAVRNREWLLERVMNNHFKTPKQETDVNLNVQPLTIIATKPNESDTAKSLAE